MTTKGDRNTQNVDKGYNAIHSHIFIRTCWHYSHIEISVHGYEIQGVLKLVIQRSAVISSELKHS
jgi:hypothetical protein